MRRLWFLFLVLTFSAPARAGQKIASCDQLLQDLWLRGLIMQNIQQARRFPPHSRAAAVDMILNGLVDHLKFPRLDFHVFERVFRAEGFPLYLVAHPDPLMPGITLAYSPTMAQFKGNTEPKYYLWIGLNGKDEADQLKRKLGVSDQENLQRLHETGRLTATSAEQLNGPGNLIYDEETKQDLSDLSKKPPADNRNN